MSTEQVPDTIRLIFIQQIYIRYADLPVIRRDIHKFSFSADIILIGNFRIPAPEHGTESTHITIRNTRKRISDILSSLCFC